MDPYTTSTNGHSPQPQPPHSQQHQQRRESPPRGVTLEDKPSNPHRRNNSHFGSHDDFYAFLDNNRGPAMAVNPNGSTPNGAGEMAPPQAPMPPQQQQQQQQQLQQQQQRNGSSQSRPPVTNIFPDRSRPTSHSGSYTGSRSEELLLVDRNSGAKMARQNQRRGAPPIKPAAAPRQRATSPTPPVSGGSSPTHPHSSRPVSGAGDRENGGGPIQRLRTPNVLECVLQPLEQKIREYDQLMRREQEEIKRLDDELRVFQARRAEAEGKFDDAKAKHDEYRRQYNDVERAMSGELPMSPREPQQRPTTMNGPGPGPSAQQRPMSARRFGDEGEEFEEDDEEFAIPPFGPGRRINSQQSFGRASQKTGGKERFRFSNLFGSAR
ncbi:hypothetical protein E0Z10_g10415 [Xylaria hypoxylon]|uniref:Uncharacterized protein n=1 Tax=Xylaria hypoxylon TaxID=37992 RepID=A0A4Z0Y3N8_9PEZI|nr:hypothetical protein E0Z10_g10415 [Xylaria hypoxylon]